MEIGNIVYLHIADLESTLVVQQQLLDYRFGIILSITPIKGGKNNEQYLKYRVQSLTEPDKIYEANNYLSPYKLSTLPELEKAIKDNEEIINDYQLSRINSLVEYIKGLIK